MHHLAVAATVFGIVFLAELPDKSLLASLVLGTRHHPVFVWAGATAAFVVHVVIAVLAGGLLSLLPQRLVEAVVAVLFGLGAYLAFRGEGHDEDEEAPPSWSAHGVIALAFGVVFVSEWGDITQLATANLSAKYGDPISVGVGAVLGLSTVVAVGIAAGRRLIERLPVHLLSRITGAVLALFAVVSAVAAVRG